MKVLSGISKQGSLGACTPFNINVTTIFTVLKILKTNHTKLSEWPCVHHDRTQHIETIVVETDGDFLFEQKQDKNKSFF